MTVHGRNRRRLALADRLASREYRLAREDAMQDPDETDRGVDRRAEEAAQWAWWWCIQRRPAGGGPRGMGLPELQRRAARPT